jgi:hypothetical protein
MSDPAKPQPQVVIPPPAYGQITPDPRMLSQPSPVVGVATPIQSMQGTFSLGSSPTGPQMTMQNGMFDGFQYQQMQQQTAQPTYVIGPGGTAMQTSAAPQPTYVIGPGGTVMQTSAAPQPVIVVAQVPQEEKGTPIIINNNNTQQMQQQQTKGSGLGSCLAGCCGACMACMCCIVM